MSDDWTCTMHSPQEREQLLSALAQAGIPADHVTASPPEYPVTERSAAAADAEGAIRPLADGAVSACIGGAFGAYVGAFSVLLPGIRPLRDIGPGHIILGSAAICALAGIVIPLAIKACFPDHVMGLRAKAEEAAPVTLTIHGDDRRESQLIHEVLVATGHRGRLHARAPGRA